MEQNMEHTRRYSQSGSWMDTLKLAASIRTVPSEWVPHSTQLHQDHHRTDWFPALKPASPSRCPSPPTAHKRFRSEESIRVDHLHARQECSDFNQGRVPGALYSPLTSGGSMTSLDELVMMNHSHPTDQLPTSRSLFRCASRTFTGLEGADAPRLPAKKQASPETSSELATALYSLLHDDSADVESLLKAMLKAKLSQAMADGLQDCDIHHLRQIQNLVWDMQADEDGKADGTDETSSPQGLSECCSGTSGTKRKRRESGPNPRGFDLNF